MENSNFIANTVHEIRTPVQTIIGTLELLSDTKLNTEQTEYVRQIKFGADVLLTLVNDILDFSKIHSNNFSLENIPYDVISLTEQTAYLESIEAFNKNIELVTDIDYSIPPLVMGDPTRVKQILLNIIKNAITDNKTYFDALYKQDYDSAMEYITIQLRDAILSQNMERAYLFANQLMDVAYNPELFLLHSLDYCVIYLLILKKG